MSDRGILDELDRVLDAHLFAPADPAAAIRLGIRARRRRTTRVAVGAASVLAVAGVLTATRLSTPSPGQPTATFGNPGGRVSLVAGGGPRDGYPDLVVSREGKQWVRVTGFGWPMKGMAPVSSADGSVTFPKVSKVDAETMCLPMLNQGAPGVPDSAWRHSHGWVDEFPSRVGLVATYEASYDGHVYNAACTLPGDFSPGRRPNLAHVPAAGDRRAVLEQCSYQGHVNFGAWRVGAADRAGATLSAALVSPDGHVARCALSSDPRQRVTQISATPVAAAEPSGPYLYGGQGTDHLTLAGAAGAGVDFVAVTVAGATRTVPVTGGVFAAVVHVPGGAPGEDTDVRALGADGRELGVVRAQADNPPNDMLIPVECLPRSRPVTTAASCRISGEMQRRLAPSRGASLLVAGGCQRRTTCTQSPAAMTRRVVSEPRYTKR
ncbi:hypothetical protein KRR39_08145 [Nocardioides panacis]|uniref:Uncharacterized protein n=1 Tax=Nocardioides panacis TaxID=2849501 RepID=A0A975T2I7_9ACTN|nr:hypothetical protein [Nocardioides panacis]QWZ09699.1 hypothetical protein KRR39_08145 [Nocardioides panacis]